MIHKLTMLEIDNFMEEFVKPVAGEPDDTFFDNLFDSVPTTGQESNMYKAFVDAVNNKEMLGDFSLAATASYPDQLDPSKRKVDCGMYLTGSRAITEERTDWTTIEVSIEFKKHHTNDDPYDETEMTGHPIADQRRKNLGQITTYGSLVFKYQPVTRHFNVVLLGSCVRIGMWDRAGVVFSSKFDYKANPAKLGRVLWRLSHASPEARGHDPSAVRILPNTPEYDAMVAWKTKTLPEANDYARELFVNTLDENYPWYKLTVPCENGTKHFLVAKPTFVAPGMVGRGTHGYVAHDVSDQARPFAYLKDCWRVEHGRSKQEGEILAYLNSKRVKNIPTLLCHGDIFDQKTVAQAIWQRVNGDPERKCQMKKHRHYRIVVKEVGRPIYEFSNGKQLIKVLSDCVLAHKEAYKKAKVIHRDVSVGNMIMIPVDKSPQGTPIYRGLLTDWELSKDINEYDQEPRHPDRTGTWQYLSVNALNRPMKHIEVADDLESFLYVLIWCAIRYLPHDCPDVGHFMYYFFDHGETTNHKEYTCGLLKRLAISDGYLMTNMQRAITFLREPLPTPVEAPMTRNDPAPLLPAPTETPLTPKSTPLSSPAATPSAPAGSSSLPPEIPQEQKHPVHQIITVLLRRFERYYKAQKFSSLVPVKSRDIVSLSGFDDSAYDLAQFDSDSDSGLESDSDTDSDSGWDLSDDRSLASARNRKKIARKANSHRVFGNLLIDTIRDKDVKWPLNDRLADQLDPNYRPDREDKTREKRTREEEKPLESDSKRLCTDASRT
ncbi:hypothetical protein GY45DRAFT_1272980 [Cubamyces sp. BRFM 1775]|nr:hypothetical protein GY45DRAFT_1272980 [Cubamyces sp. BRFM 1775]